MMGIWPCIWRQKNLDPQLALYQPAQAISDRSLPGVAAVQAQAAPLSGASAPGSALEARPARAGPSAGAVDQPGSTT
jgi:hypothetical protein